MAVRSRIRLFKAACSEEAEQAVLGVLRSGQVASGPMVDEFQTQLGTLIGRPHVVCTSDMTHAIAIALRLAGVAPGDDVLTLAYSCMSSNTAISLAGARPVWVDIDPLTASMSVDDLRRAITPRCKAVTLYHVAGYPGPSEAIAAICREHGLALIEDCNNALGSMQSRKHAGLSGQYTVYSFYPNRQVNAIEGGALVCPDAATAARASRLRRFGIDMRTFRDSMGEINPSSDIPEIGWSAAFNQLNAAVGLRQLPQLEERLAKTRDNAQRLRQLLVGTPGIQVIRPLENAEPAYWVLLLLAEQRDTLLVSLKRLGVECSKLHLRNDLYSGFHAVNRHLPGTDHFMDQVIGIPCGWWLDDAEVSAVAEAVRYIAVSGSSASARPL